MRRRFQTLSYLLDDVRSLSWNSKRLLFGGGLVFILLLIKTWRVMVPFLLLVIGVAFYLRYSRPKNSL